MNVCIEYYYKFFLIFNYKTQYFQHHQTLEKFYSIAKNSLENTS